MATLVDLKSDRHLIGKKPHVALSRTASAWFAVALIGQFAFAVFILVFYGGAALVGDLAQWNKGVTHGYEEGATVSNLIVGIHLFFAAVISIGGPLQFIPSIRQRFPAFHRWNGRVYGVLTFIAAISGIYMLYAHDDSGGAVSRPAMTIEAAIVLFAGVVTWRKAISGQFIEHERWAFRLFLTASGVWYFRVILMGWILINGGPVGFDPVTFKGPFLDVVSYAHYLLPLAIYELYWRAKQGNSSGVQYGVAVLMILCTVFTIVGVIGAVVGLWLPTFKS